MRGDLAKDRLRPTGKPSLGHAAHGRTAIGNEKPFATQLLGDVVLAGGIAAFVGGLGLYVYFLIVEIDVQPTRACVGQAGAAERASGSVAIQSTRSESRITADSVFHENVSVRGCER